MDILPLTVAFHYIHVYAVYLMKHHIISY